MDTEIFDTNSTSLSCGLLSRAPATERSIELDNFFDCIVTGDESWIHHYDSLSQLQAKVWTRLGE